jgi:NAD(P)-dependent dehydrogenase (short-subunit alcohol dehydrogenase family)
MTMEPVAGKVAFVSGASRGIGAGLAERYAELGMKLVLCSRSEPVLPDGPDVLARPVDVRDEEGIEKLVREAEARFGSIDLWVNNAGVLEPVKPVRETSTEAFREHLDVNLIGVFIGTRAYIAHRRRISEGGTAGGILINVSSGASWNAYEGWGAYCAGKAGAERLSEVVAAEEAASGLRVYSVAPGVADTPMQDHVREADVSDFPEVERFREMKRGGALNSVRYVADELLAIAFDLDRRPETVAYRLENENEN